MNTKQVIYKETKNKNGSINIHLNCPHCGKPINKTSVEFGMDCKDHCAEKAYKKLIEADPEAKAMDNFLQQIKSPATFADCNDDKDQVFEKVFGLLEDMIK
jgi:hypothetical protein